MRSTLVNFLITIWIWIVVVVATLLVTPPIAFASVVLGPFDPQRRWAHYFCILWGEMIFKANPGWKITINGTHHIRPRQPYVIVSNHSSVADIISLYLLRIQFKWLAKRSLFRIPFFGWNMSLLHYIPLERGAHGSIRDSFEKAKEWLKKGMSVLIFPEGTRSRDGSLGAFKNGAFKLAIEMRVPVLPVVIAGTGSAATKGKATFGSHVRGFMTVLAPIDTRNYRPEDFDKLKTKVRALIHRDLESTRRALA
jgi:1-acyl-sn-glycerol-3-phosphate acyltransferase